MRSPSLRRAPTSPYWDCTRLYTSPPTVIITVGTNNSYHDVSNSGGSAWHDVLHGIWVSATAGAIGARVSFIGGNDIESWGAPAPAEAWADGWDATTTGYYLNFGSADGCPQTTATNGACNNGYHQYDYYKLSWGNPNAIVEPQIYTTNGAQAAQWKEICLYGVTQGKTIQFEGPLNEYYSDSSTDTPAASWSQLWNDLNGTSCAQTPPFETSFKWQ